MRISIRQLLKFRAFGNFRAFGEPVDLTGAIDRIEGLSNAERIGYHDIYGTLLAIAKRPVSQAELEEQLRCAVAARAHEGEIFRRASAQLNGFRHYIPLILMSGLLTFALREELSALAAWGTWKLPFVLITGLVLMVHFVQNWSERRAALRFAAARGWSLLPS